MNNLKEKIKQLLDTMKKKHYQIVKGNNCHFFIKWEHTKNKNPIILINNFKFLVRLNYFDYIDYNYISLMLLNILQRIKENYLIFLVIFC